jgi:GPR180/TMEM145, transmembrane domain
MSWSYSRVQLHAICSIIVAITICTHIVNGETVTGTVSSSNGFAYLGKFCYDFTPKPSAGDDDTSTMQLDVQLQARIDYVPQGDSRLYVFDDQSNSWPMVYNKESLSCKAKINQARNSTAVHFTSNDASSSTIARIHEHMRPRFWYIVLANCEGFYKVDYTIQFRNQGSMWFAQFGVNEQSLNTLYVVFFILYCIGAGFHVLSLRFVSENPLHPIVKLLTAAIFSEFAAVFLGMVHYASFTSNGSGLPAIKALSDAMQVASHLIFVVLLITLAQGWTISTDELRNRSQIVRLMAMFVFAYALLVIWDVTGRDPASTLYIYESYPGIAILSLNMFAGVWFVYSLYHTYREEDRQEKQWLYRMLGFGFSMWFALLPLTVLLAAILDPWVREKTVVTVDMCGTAIAYFYMALLLWPSKAAQYFRIYGPDVTRHADDDL